MPRAIFLSVLGLALFSAQTYAAAVVIHDHDYLALAPAGDRTADVESDDPGNLADEPHGRVVVRGADGRILATYDPCKTCKYSDAVWSPAGDTLAFIATDGKAGTATLYAAEKNKARVLAKISGIANDVRYAPDGARIALLATVGAHKMTGAVEAGAAQVGEIGVSNDEQRIAVLPAKGGALKLVSPADTYVYEFDWAPGGFAATAAKGNGDNNWWIATLDFIGEDGSARVIAAPGMQIELPRVSPDGKTVAFIGGLMSDWRSIGGDLYLVPLAGGAPRDIRPDFAGSFRSIDWRGNRLMTGALIGGLYSIALYNPSTGQLQPPDFFFKPMSVRTWGVGSPVASSADGKTVAVVAEDFNHADEILLGGEKGLAPITHDNAGLTPNVHVENVGWTNDGFTLQGWLIGPKQTQPGQKYPMVVIVHGGPSSAYTPHYIAAGGQHGGGFDFAYDLIQRGTYIFYPNDRGSYGQGEAFTRANIKDFGRGDFRDMMAGVDAVEKMAPIDDSRLGLYGHSYGGWFSMWADTQTNRFKAFVAGAGIANWTSYYGQNGIDQWMIPFFGASVYDDPKVYRDASPIEFIKSARTPMLLYVGERDVECPAPQSLEYWHALRTIGTPAQLVIYAGEGHRFRKLSDLADLRARILGWFGRYLN